MTRVVALAALALAGVAAAVDVPADYAAAIAAADFPQLLSLLNRQFDIPPIPLGPPDAVYPAVAGEAGAQGTVKLLLYIDDAGAVRDVVIADSPGWLALEEAATKAAKTVRYRPATRDDRPVAVWYVLDMIYYIPAADD